MIRAELEKVRRRWGAEGAAELDTGAVYADGGPVVVRVRKRSHRYDIDDSGRAVESAGRPDGWLPVAERVVEKFALNVRRNGVVFVQAVEGRDIAALAERVADASRAVHAELLELT